MRLPSFVEHIGRTAHFLIPIAKIDMPLANGDTPRVLLKRFLEEKYGGSTQDPHVQGVWKALVEAHVGYSVAFKKECILDFLEFLRSLCLQMSEECIFLEMGEETYLVRPR